MLRRLFLFGLFSVFLCFSGLVVLVFVVKIIVFGNLFPVVLGRIEIIVSLFMGVDYDFRRYSGFKDKISEISAFNHSLYVFGDFVFIAGVSMNHIPECLCFVRHNITPLRF